MLFFLRKIRKKLMQKNKLTTYLLYAIGEIILVVIGILIAVSINNLNNKRLSAERERQYLTNIKSDLEADLASIDLYHSTLNTRIEKGEQILDFINGEEITDYLTLYYDLTYIAGISHFKPNNVTVAELISSGNLSVITNDSIKQLLLQLEGDYQENLEGIEHELFDYEQYISIPLNKIIDQEGAYNLYYREAKREDAKYSRERIHELLDDTQFKNGVVITIWMSRIHIAKLTDIQQKSEKIVALINNKIQP